MTKKLLLYVLWFFGIMVAWHYAGVYMRMPSDIYFAAGTALYVAMWGGVILFLASIFRFLKEIFGDKEEGTKEEAEKETADA